MMQYLMSMLAQRPGGRGDGFAEMFGPMFGGVGDDEGRWGDYVFSQEALDRIMTQLMENSNASRPVPAPEDVINKLDKCILEQGSPLLEKDCAVCKEQFKLETEDPDEQRVVTLPCKHPFHEPCIIPWLKSSGTCPVCRFALVPQPDHHEPGSPPSGPGNSSRPGSPSNRPDRTRSPGPRGSGGSSQNGGGSGGFLSNILSHINPMHGGSNSNNNSGATGHSRRRSNPNNNGTNLPGSWSEPVD